MNYCNDLACAGDVDDKSTAYISAARDKRMLLAVALGYEQLVPLYWDSFGLCFNMHNSAVIQRIIKTWPERSNMQAYPVPAPDSYVPADDVVENYIPRDCYDDAKLESSLYTGEYGQMRRELAYYCYQHYDAACLEWRIELDAMLSGE